MLLFLCIDVVYTNMKVQNQSKYEEQRAKYLEMSSGTITASATTNTAGTSEPKRMATPDDYDNEELYEEMSACFYVSS